MKLYFAPTPAPCAPPGCSTNSASTSSWSGSRSATRRCARPNSPPSAPTDASRCWTMAMCAFPKARPSRNIWWRATARGRLAPDAASPSFPTYLQWLHYGEGMIMGPMNNYVVETLLLPPDRRSEEHARRALRLMGRVLQALDAHMADRDYLAGESSPPPTRSPAMPASCANEWASICRNCRRRRPITSA